MGPRSPTPLRAQPPRSHLEPPVLALSPDDHVNVEVLEDVMTVSDGTIVRATTVRFLTRAPLDLGAALGAVAPPPVARGLAAELGARAWSEIRITVVDGHTVRIGCGKVLIRRTYRDLGLHAENTREPTQKWTLLLAICAGHGTFRWKDFGSFRAVSQGMSVLRRKLGEAFGIEEDPFTRGSAARGWKAKFFASSEVGED